MKNKFLFMVGTRPEAIKIAPVYLFFKKNGLDVVLCSSGQHREMMDQVLDIFDLTLDFDLNLMKPNQRLTEFSSRLIEAFVGLLEEIQPSMVLVHGDTTTSAISTLAAYYSHIPVAHIEAGLRTYNLASPYPEEGNRQVIARLAKFHFAPTQSSKKNLMSEGISEGNIFVTGNTVVDSLRWINEKFEKSPVYRLNLTSRIEKKIKFDFEVRKYVLITAHRRENFGQGIENICRSLVKLAADHKDLYFIYPVHPNPNIKNVVINLLSNIPNFILMEPLAYDEFIMLLRFCVLVITDSGGIQEEAPSFGKKVLLLRENSERNDSIDDGDLMIVGTDPEKICSAFEKLISTPSQNQGFFDSPFGDGHSSSRIYSVLSGEGVIN